MADIINLPTNVVTAYFYMHEFSEDDPFPDLDDYRTRAETFISAMNTLYPILKDIESDEGTKEDMQFEIYEIGKSQFGTDKGKLRDFFRLCYYAITQTDSGGRLGEVFHAMGVDDVYAAMNRNMSEGLV